MDRSALIIGALAAFGAFLYSRSAQAGTMPGVVDPGTFRMIGPLTIDMANGNVVSSPDAQRQYQDSFDAYGSTPGFQPLDYQSQLTADFWGNAPETVSPDENSASLGPPLNDWNTIMSKTGFIKTGGALDQQSAGNLNAFLLMLRQAEGTASADGYAALYGYRPGNGKVFTDFSKHPNVYFKTPWGGTTAAGAYQITFGTYKDAAAATGLTDFSPATQDAMAVWLIDRRGRALQDVLAGRVQAAIAKLGNIWASLPSSKSGQPQRSLDQLVSVYQNQGGLLDPGAADGGLYA